MAGHLHGVQGVASSNLVVPTTYKKALLSGAFFMPHYVYILQSLKDLRYYIGETHNVEQRLTFHNSGKQRSTRNRTPFKIVLTEEYQTREQALKREKQIKSWKGGESFKKLVHGT